MIEEKKQSAHKGRKPGSKNKRPYNKRADKALVPATIVPATIVRDELPTHSESRLPLDVGFNMAYPLPGFPKAIPTPEDLDRGMKDMVNTIQASTDISKVVSAIAQKNPSILQSLQKYGIDPSCFQGGHNFMLSEIVVIQRITGTKIL